MTECRKRVPFYSASKAVKYMFFVMDLNHAYSAGNKELRLFRKYGN